MLRLIISFTVLPLMLQIFPDWLFDVTTEMMPPKDLSVPAEEHALRDLIPEWEPVRALTEEEMVRPWSPFRMESGGFYEVGGYKAAPTIPSTWIAHWPEPAPLEPTAVPRGWWWKPKAPEHLGIWLVLSKGRTYGVFYDMVTTPLRAVDLANVPQMPAMHALYTALRDREAKRRGVDPATLDREAKRIESGAPPPSEVDEAIRRARELDDADRMEDAIDLLTRLIDEDAGTDRDRARMLAVLAALHGDIGDFPRALALYKEVRPLADDLDLPRIVALADEEIARIEALDPFSKAAHIAMRGLASAQRGNDTAARARYEQGLAIVDVATDVYTAHDLHYLLAQACERLGDAHAARTHATAALALTPRVDLPTKAAEMRALLTRLDAAAPPPR